MVGWEILLFSFDFFFFFFSETCMSDGGAHELVLSPSMDIYGGQALRGVLFLLKQRERLREMRVRSINFRFFFFRERSPQGE